MVKQRSFLYPALFLFAAVTSLALTFSPLAQAQDGPAEAPTGLSGPAVAEGSGAAGGTPPPATTPSPNIAPTRATAGDRTVDAPATAVRGPETGASSSNEKPAAAGEGAPGPAVSAPDVSAPAETPPARGTAEMPARPEADDRPTDPGSAPQEALPPAEASNPPLAAEPVTLERDFSIRGMFLSADGVIKAVMIGLILASVVTWTVWLAKTVEIRAAKKQISAGVEALARVNSLAEAVEKLAVDDGPARELIGAAVVELELSSDVPSSAGLKDRVDAQLELIEAAFSRAIGRGVGVLATIAATAPFVGLFGTVWGIMNSFIGISKAQTTNLAVVAPGIAEALLTTAFGLAAAIPAVIMYNALARSIAGYRALLRTASAAVLRLMSRDLDRQGSSAVIKRLISARQAAE